MRQMIRVFSVLVFTFICMAGFPQGTKADYQRANSFHQGLREKLINARIDVNWSSDGKVLLFDREELDGRKELLKLEAGRRVHWCLQLTQVHWPFL